jgi:multiple sugar transport system permease protein
MRGKTGILRTLFLLTVTGVFAAAFFLPVLVSVTNSFMSGFEITNRYADSILPGNIHRLLAAAPRFHFVDMALVPGWVSLEQYAALLFDAAYLRKYWNSILITLPVVAGQLCIAVPAAYALEIGAWKHKEKLFFVYMLIMLMPLPVMLVPQFVLANFFEMEDSVFAVILPAFFNPFGVFLLRQFFKTLPVDCIEAAKIDGAGHFVILFAVVTPLVKPAAAALAILVFADYWNVVEQAVVFIADARWEPLSVFLSKMGNTESIFAASCFYMLPALLMFLYGQEYLAEGIQLSGIK